MRGRHFVTLSFLIAAAGCAASHGVSSTPGTALVPQSARRSQVFVAKFVSHKPNVAAAAAAPSTVTPTPDPDPSPSCPAAGYCVEQGGSLTIPDVGEWEYYNGSGAPIIAPVPMTFQYDPGFTFTGDPNPAESFSDFGVTVHAEPDAPIGENSDTITGQFQGALQGQYIYAYIQFQWYVLPGCTPIGSGAAPTLANTATLKQCKRDQLQILDADASPAPAVIAPSAMPVTKIAGQHVSLQAGAKYGSSLSNISWTVSPAAAAVSSYALTTGQTSLPKPVPIATGNGNTFDFYWTRGVDPGKNFVVALTAKVGTQPGLQTVNAKYSVLNATLTGSSGGTSGRVGLCYGLDCFPGRTAKVWSLTFGRGNAGSTPAPQPGMTYNYNVMTPPNGDPGNLGMVQLISYNCVHNGTLGPTRPFQLDNQSFYSANPVTTQTSAGSGTWTGSDSPQIQLDPSWANATLHDQFKSYFMYQPPPTPNDANVIWVPVAVMDWGFAGTAVSHFYPKWTLTSSSNPPTTVMALPTYEFPSASTTFNNRSARCN